MTPVLQPLVTFCQSAELTTSVLLRMDRASNTQGSSFNAYAVMRFLPSLRPSSGSQFQYLTPSLENSPSGAHRLFVSRSILTVTEALSLCNFKGGFLDPRAPPGTQ